MPLQQHCGFKGVSTVYREGVKKRADPLSRRETPSHYGFTTKNSMTNLTAPPIIKELSNLLNPSVNTMEESLLLNLMGKCNSISLNLSFD